MRIYGIDFTSAPSRRKPITCAVFDLVGRDLSFKAMLKLTSFDQFEGSLASPGPWTAAIDFPFGQSKKFVENIGWPRRWSEYVEQVASMSRQGFKQLMKDYRDPRPKGDKEHRRTCDVLARAVSPQKVYGVPVGLMFFAGAKRILASGATIAGLHHGDPDRLIFEAYPGVLARRATSAGYKSDDAKKQSSAHRTSRDEIYGYLTGTGAVADYGLNVSAPRQVEEDPTGDSIDAIICAVQAAWAWSVWPNLDSQLTADQRLEGWIADPMVFDEAPRPH